LASTGQRIVGRKEELAHVDHALEGLAERKGARVVEISGESGIGKTRLLEELCDRAERREYLVLRGQAAEFERGVPFAPMVEAFDAYLASLDPGRLKLPEGELRDELAAVFPSLRTGRAHGGGVHDERYRAYRAIRELLERLAGPRPLVVAIDDLQWADDASAELLSALLRKPPPASVLLALCARSGQAPEPLEPALGAAERRPGAHRLRLGPLGEREADELLSDRLPPPLRRAVYEAGGGNPFFMEQLARATGLETSVATAVELPRLELPPAISAALAEELGALPEGTRALLQAAAVAGERFEPDLVADIAGVDEPVVLAALDELLERELVRSTDVPRRFAFRHPLVWRAVYEGARGGWRLSAHAAAAEALAARGAAAVERAHHVEHAARRGDERAVAVLREAGEAIATRTPSAAARWFRGALRLLPEGPSHDALRRELLVELASALRGAGDLGACREALRDALDLLPPEDARGRARLEAACATVESWLGRADDGRRRLLRTRAAIGDEESPEAVMLDIRLALDALNSLEFDRGAELARGAHWAARRLDDSALVAEATSALSLAHGLAGQVELARRHHREALEALEGLPEGALADRIEIFFYLAWAENYIEEPERAIATAERGIALSRATAQGHLLVPLMLARALPNDMLGRLAESVKTTEEALAAARTAPNPQYLFWALWECAYSYVLAGDTARALSLCEESIEASRGLAPNFLSWSQPGTTYGWALIQNGEPERGVPMYIEAAGGPEAPRLSAYEQALVFQQVADGLLALGRLDEAAEYARLAESLAERLDLSGPHALAAQTRAALLLAQGRAREAAEVARAAGGPASARGLRVDAAHLRRLEALALTAMGERKAAVAAFREVEREFDSFPSVRARDEVRRELRKLGARVEPRGPVASSLAGLEVLSPREREIAELVADRRTNKEIAGRLFLSDKTVETHLRNIFRKLSASSRVEVARAVERAHRRT
jgi:DNA-binding CsgD family transcriptional regulator/tetratricopeptide (TPR) repeat protein